MSEPLDARTIANLWLAAGGARSRLVAAVAVALAASGGDPSMSTPAGRVGLWGLSTHDVRKLKVPAVELLDADMETTLAVRLSGNGTNWALWPVVWAPGTTIDVKQSILWPQLESDAWKAMAIAQVHVGTWDGVDYADAYGDPLNDLTQAWNTLSWALTSWSAQAWNSINDTAYLARGLQRT